MRVGLGEGGQGYHRVCLALWEGKGEAAGLPWATPLKGKGKEKMMNLRASCHSARYQRVPWGKEVPLQNPVGEKRLIPLGRGMSRRNEEKGGPHEGNNCSHPSSCPCQGPWGRPPALGLAATLLGHHA